jgi:hypothetical protein
MVAFFAILITGRHPRDRHLLFAGLFDGAPSCTL